MSQLQVDHTVGCDDAVFLFHVSSWFQINGPTGILYQNPSGRYIPKANSLFDVSVKPSARNVRHVKSSASHETAFSGAVHHFLKKGNACGDCCTAFGEAH